MSDSVNYKEIHAYMLKKTAEYYQCPPAVLVEAIMEDYKNAGYPVSYDEAKKRVTSLQIQRYIKEEMQKKWPDFMASIPSNPLRMKSE